jgi:hypothetical protein
MASKAALWGEVKDKLNQNDPACPVGAAAFRIA